MKWACQAYPTSCRTYRLRSDQIRSDQLLSAQQKNYHTKWGPQARSGSCRSDQVRSGQIKSPISDPESLQLCTGDLVHLIRALFGKNEKAKKKKKKKNNPIQLTDCPLSPPSWYWEGEGCRDCLGQALPRWTARAASTPPTQPPLAQGLRIGSPPPWTGNPRTSPLIGRASAS